MRAQVNEYVESIDQLKFSQKPQAILKKKKKKSPIKVQFSHGDGLRELGIRREKDPQILEALLFAIFPKTR